MKKLRKFTVLFLVAVLLSLCLAVFTACDKPKAPENQKVYKKNAVLIVTALTSGGLYDTRTGEVMWDPLGGDATFEQAMYGDMVGLVVGAIVNKGSRDKIFSVLKFGSEEDLANNWLWQLILDENGEPTHNPYLVPTNDPFTDGKTEYGALASYRRNTFAIRDYLDSIEFTDQNGLKHPVSDDWDVDVFNYDWRMDCRVNSRLLEEYINEKYPDGKVILTSHSLGGPVVAGYLARSQENRDRVLAYIANAPAFYGSVNALMFMDDPVGSVYDVVKGAGIDLQSMNITIADEGLQKLAAPLAQNMPSVMQLLPFPQFLDSEWYYSKADRGEDGAPVAPPGTRLYVRKADGTFAPMPATVAPDADVYYKTGCAKIRGATPEQDRYIFSDELYDFYTSRSWAKRKDGTLKPCVADLREYWDSLSVDTDADGTVDTFAPELVNTYYLLGTGIATLKTLVYDSETDQIYDRNEMINGEGDGTVPLSASTGGIPLTKLQERDRVYIFGGHGHGNVGADWMLVGDTHLEILEKVMKDRYGELTEKGA